MSKPRDDGGSAFGGSWDEVFTGTLPPGVEGTTVSSTGAFKIERRAPGMTLRDYFAAAALQGYIAHGGTFSTEALVQRAYQVADRMLEERKRGT